MTYKEFRERSPHLPFMSASLASNMCYPMSPFISMFCIKHKISPNTITFLMILLGAIGGIILMIPNTWCKLLAAIIYYLWYTFDLSDGEVARMTKTFSKGGKYLDWCAHLVCHPLFIIGMYMSFYSLDYCSSYFLYITFFLICVELINRNVTAITELYNVKEGISSVQNEKLGVVRYIWSVLFYFPDLVILFPFFLAIDMFFQWNIVYYVYFIWAVIYCLNVTRGFITFVLKMYKSE